MADVFKGDALEGVNQQFLFTADKRNDESEKLEPIQDDTTAALWITRPINDAVLFVGDVVLAFETRGFTSMETPIEVSFKAGNRCQESYMPFQSERVVVINTAQ